MTKYKVLSLLKQADGFLSGEQIRSGIGVSRMAVSAAVKALRAEGYEITAVTNRGYRLDRSPDYLTVGELMALLGEKRAETILCLDTVDSTNRYLKSLANDGAPTGTVVIADGQTKGRGRRGRSFDSPKGKGIYLSYLLRPECTPAESTTLTAWAAVAAASAVSYVCGVEPNIKWVNDLLLDGKKLCGILTELSIESESNMVDYVVVGIGMNVNEKAEDFPPRLRDIAISLAQVLDREQPRAALCAELIRRMDQLSLDWPQERESYLAAYRRCEETVGRDVRVVSPGAERYAHALAIEPDFSLRVRFDDGEEARLRSGEISIRG